VALWSRYMGFSIGAPLLSRPAGPCLLESPSSRGLFNGDDLSKVTVECVIFLPCIHVFQIIYLDYKVSFTHLWYYTEMPP